MNNPTEMTCRWCGIVLANPKREQRFCCSSHRYRWHTAQRISPASFDERVRAIVRDELNRATEKPRPAPAVLRGDHAAWNRAAALRVWSAAPRARPFRHLYGHCNGDRLIRGPQASSGPRCNPCPGQKTPPVQHERFGIAFVDLSRMKSR